jgi:hypothetical protein
MPAERAPLVDKWKGHIAATRAARPARLRHLNWPQLIGEPLGRVGVTKSSSHEGVPSGLAESTRWDERLITHRPAISDQPCI